MATRRHLQQLANSLIGDNPKLPINIDKIIKSQGLKLVPYDEDGVSGILMIEQNNTTIAYAQHESPKRQRFTKAHELGHFMLHRGVVYLLIRILKQCIDPLQVCRLPNGKNGKPMNLQLVF